VVRRFARARSREHRLECLANPLLVGERNENDARSVARFVKRPDQELGQEAGEDFDQASAEMQPGTVEALLEAEPRS
jgi:hypothetical protein